MGVLCHPARGEWVRSNEEMPKEGYMKYFEEFNPEEYNLKEWARLAKEAGMKYVRAEGLKVGIYSTLIDWLDDNYPHFGDKHHSMRNNSEYSDENRDFDCYLDYMHNQVKEIYNNYEN